FHTCALDPTGIPACWGKDDYLQAYPPNEVFTAITAGDQHSCGLRPDNTIGCWGDNGFGQATPPVGTFRSISAGSYHTCGIQTDNTLACWGYDFFGQAAPPTGLFSSVTGGYFHSCGVRTDSTLACWGDNDDGQATPPSGLFRAVAAGARHSCGLRTDGTLTCWGYNGNGEATPPSGTFVALDAGYAYTCALRTDGTLACWGLVLAPPVGTFLSLTVGGAHACAVRSDGTLACWGQNGDGQAPQLTISPPTLPNGTSGLAYSQQLTTTGTLGAAPPYTDTLLAGSLPPALTLNAAGLISGSLTSAGTYTFTIQTQDGHAIAATQSYTLTISDPPPPSITPTSTHTATATDTPPTTPTSLPSAIPTQTAAVPSAIATQTAAVPSATATQARTPPSATATQTAPPTATSTACTIRFSDVNDPSAYYYEPVYYLACHGVLGGYSDGTFRPYNQTTRGQIAKIVVLAFAVLPQTPTGRATFADVAPGSTFLPYVETAAARGIVSGYTCGGTDPQTGAPEPCDTAQRPYYRPAGNVTRGQLTKIVVLSAGWALHTPAGPTFSDVAAASVFYPSIETAVCHGIISGYSDGTFRPANPATRGQIAKISVLAVTNDPARCGPARLKSP
ncbi:MAG: S-layer homology domain-containing protein, partial [Chloroflexota bacterium]|nr:S-layer homology domain-containing protein [Chloroflexota bacterium]